MPLPHVPYAPLTTAQMSYLDDTFGALGNIAIITCDATGTNTVALTPTANAPSVSAYVDRQLFAFTAAGTSTGTITININSIGAQSLYLNALQTAGANALIAGEYYIIVYSATLMGFILVSGSAGPRIKLGANLSLYVSPSGLDSNTGITGSPFQTIQHAWNVLQNQYDLNGYVGKISIAAGTYSGLSITGIAPGALSSGDVIIQGNPDAPGDVVLKTSGASVHAVFVQETQVSLSSLTVKTGGASADGILVQQGTNLVLNNVAFDVCGANHMQVTYGGQVTVNNAYSIVGGAQAHLVVQSQGNYKGPAGSLITVTSSINFSSAFFVVTTGGYAESLLNTFSGSATGTRFAVTSNGVINVGGNLTYLPGSATGTSSTGGQYI